MPEDMGFLDTIKRQHLGKWIGVKGKDVLVISDSHDDVLRELRERDVDGAYVFYSPTEAEKKYGFLFLVRKWKLSTENSFVM